MTSNANDLRARIQQRIDAQDLKLDEIDERTLQAYGERWDAIVNAKLPLIDAAMEQVNGRILDTLRTAPKPRRRRGSGGCTACCGAPGSGRW